MICYPFIFELKWCLKKLRCRFDFTCIPYSAYKKVNPSSQIIIDGQCLDGCTQIVAYEYKIYYTLRTILSTDIAWTSLTNDVRLVSGKNWVKICLIIMGIYEL